MLRLKENGDTLTKNVVGLYGSVLRNVWNVIIDPEVERESEDNQKRSGRNKRRRSYERLI